MATTTFYENTATATSDTAFQVDTGTTLLTAVNIHCYTQDCYYGNRAVQVGIIRANAVAWFDGKVRVCDLWFKNVTAGQNCTVVIAGVLAEGE